MKLHTPSDLARLVKNARLKQDLTQQEVADAVGVTRQSFARIEQGNGGASFATILAIFECLGISLEARDTTAPTQQRTDVRSRDFNIASTFRDQLDALSTSDVLSALVPSEGLRSLTAADFSSLKAPLFKTIEAPNIDAALLSSMSHINTVLAGVGDSLRSGAFLRSIHEVPGSVIDDEVPKVAKQTAPQQLESRSSHDSVEQ